MVLVCSSPLQQAPNPRITFQQGSEDTLTTLWICRSVWRISSQEEWSMVAVVWDKSHWINVTTRLPSTWHSSACVVFSKGTCRGCVWNTGSHMTTITGDHLNSHPDSMKYIFACTQEWQCLNQLNFSVHSVLLEWETMAFAACVECR